METITFNAQSAWELYLSTGSVHRAAAHFGVTGETLRRRLTAAGFRLNGSKWTPEEEGIIRTYYADTPELEFSIATLALRLNRTFAAVAIRASRLGVSGKRTDGFIMSSSHRSNLSKKLKENGKTLSAEQRAAISKRTTEQLQRNGHPRGMQGKHHTDLARRQMSESQLGRTVPPSVTARQLATRRARYGTIAPKVARGSWKAEWVTIGGQQFFARSQWESNYARYLEWLRERGEVTEWRHEPDSFTFPDNTSYLPDFRVITWTGETEYHEVKGWMDARSKSNATRMRRLYPAVRLLVVDSKRYRALCRTCRNIVHGWVKTR